MIWLWAVCVLLCVGVGSMLVYTHSSKTHATTVDVRSDIRDDTFTKELPETGSEVYHITWYNPPADLRMNRAALYCGFDECPYSNCKMRLGSFEATSSDAIIFDGRYVKPRDFLPRKPGQVWIFAAHETPASYWDTGMHWTRHGWVSSFNWTMTYDKTNTDIYLPYGEVRKQPDNVTDQRNYKAVYARKNKTALIIHSHCPTRSKREEFVKRLELLVDLDSIGRCGKPMNCGVAYKHDTCFDMVNNYKFYLAFENAVCDRYFTEKLFRNYNYDAIMVVRGGRNNDVKNILPAGTFVSTDDFKSVNDLAAYLNKVSESEDLYTEILRKKSQYYSLPYRTVYQRAMCDLCERMNKQDLYRKQITNIVDWAFGGKHCQNATDLGTES